MRVEASECNEYADRYLAAEEQQPGQQRHIVQLGGRQDSLLLCLLVLLVGIDLGPNDE